MTQRRYTRYATGVVAYNLAVIVWGAYVRATGSGAGCGRHWPLCNGEVVPRARGLAQLIEFTHRLTSGVALLAVVGLVYGARKLFAPGAPARKAAHAAGALMLVEAGLGAGLVLLRLVAGNTSAARGLYLAGHLTNTFFLLAALVLAALWSREGSRPRPWAHRGPTLVVGASALGLLLITISGGIAALGDTLFPARTLAEGMLQDVSPSAHVFLRLRIWHPVLAVLLGVAIVASAWAVRWLRRDRPLTRAAGLVTLAVLGQLCLGVVNLFLLAPVALQLLHLLMADLVWVTLLALWASAVEEPENATVRR